MRALAAASPHFSISLDPSTGDSQDDGWLELLANGLTFDLTGLAPGPAGDVSPTAHSFGVRQDFDPAAHQAILIKPGPHLVAGSAMFPVVRTLAMIAANLTRLDGAQAVAWHPARALSEASFFRRSVLEWIEGGVFPGLGLAALVPSDDGGLQSEGLALFTGQELRLRPDVVPDRAEGSKTALRLLNWLVEHGAITQSFMFTGPSGEALQLEPVENSSIVEVWRGSH